ncbi:MAG: metalloprotease TldD [Deltaproteobacteria bacterium]|nr:metalloprotease TldD [Deltaproteobacteria bacterium]MBW2413324.1 metalloprotease TldD [Deltaproteobacteria bacterium]
MDQSEGRSHTSLALFRDRFGIDDRCLVAGLDTALERKVDYADLFFEYTTHSSVSLEEGIVKTGGYHVEQGVGVRVQAGERQGYAHSDEIDLDSVRLSATTARAVSEGTAEPRSIAVGGAARPDRDLYPVSAPPTDLPAERKIGLLEDIDRYARRDSRVAQVMASVDAEHRHLLMTGSDGTLVGDERPLVVLRVQVIAQDGSRREVSAQGMGGRYELEKLLDPAEWQPLVDEAVRVATVNLDAEPCPAGTMTVVLGPGWPGILLHEAVGHGLEGDFNRRGTSVFSGRIGERVASEGVTVIDDGTLDHRRGSLNVDDEGTPTGRTVLIEDGILVGYMQDRLNARLMGVEPTGNGRRQSYAHLPMPRMTNTFMLAGEEDPEDIVRSVDQGIYAASFGGGQVDITSGKFVFSASEAYRIEGGRITAPLKGATLIGSGADVLTRISRIGNDLELDKGIGTCGKDGQGVPVGVGLPTIRIDGLTVGGTEG